MTLTLSQVQKTQGQFEFGPIDLTVDDEVLAVLGPSGSGKTTLLSSVAGITAPDLGSIELDGRELVGRPLEARDIGMVFQDGALFPHMTARENIEYAATADDRVGDLAALFELGDILDRRPATLSGGERQRVALARTLATDPAALLLDEPLSSLDAPIRRRLRTDLHSLFADLEIPILYVTHDQRTAAALGDRIAIVRDGTIEQVGPSSGVLERPANEFVARFTGTANRLDGTVSDRTDAGVIVRVGDIELATPPADIPSAAVTLCLHPARVELVRPDATDGCQVANTVTGSVSRWRHDGSTYRVDIDIDGLGAPLTAQVHPPTFDRLDVEHGRTLRVRLPRKSMHLVPRGRS